MKRGKDPPHGFRHLTIVLLFKGLALTCCPSSVDAALFAEWLMYVSWKTADDPLDFQIFPEHRCWLTEPRRGKEYNDVRGSQESSRRIEFTGSVSPGACTNPLAACHNAPRYSTELVPGNVREVAEQAGICWFQHVTQKRRTSFTQASWLMVRK